MKATEVTIGDWVISKDLKVPVKVVSMVQHYGTSIFFYHDTRQYIANDFQFEPISLTPEILEKNGFSETTHAGVWFSTELPCSIDIQKNIKNKIDKLDDLYDEIVVSVDYVHELQHLLAFCGKSGDFIL